MTAAERLVMYADKFHTKSDPPTFVSRETYRRRIARFGDDKLKIFDGLAGEFGQPDLGSLAEEYGFRLVAQPAGR